MQDHAVHFVRIDSEMDKVLKSEEADAKAFEDAYKSGKIRAIGVSNFQKKHYDALVERCEIKPMVNQIEFHPGYTQPETVAYSQQNGMLVQAFSPLGCGAVLGDETLASIAKKYNKTVAIFNLEMSREQLAMRLLANESFVDNQKLVTGQLTEEEWGKIGMWAYAASRILDYLYTLDCVDKTRVGVIGHSRLGKTALWAGANDTRFKLVISNNSGCCGAALARRDFGETVEIITHYFPHWFISSFTQYANNEKSCK